MEKHLYVRATHLITGFVLQLSFLVSGRCTVPGRRYSDTDNQISIWRVIIISMALVHTFPQPVPCPLGPLMLSVAKCLLQVLKKNKKKLTKIKSVGCHFCNMSCLTQAEDKPELSKRFNNYYKFCEFVGKILLPHASLYNLQTDKRKSQSKHRPTLWLDIITDDLPEISFAKMEFSANLNWTF